MKRRVWTIAGAFVLLALAGYFKKTSDDGRCSQVLAYQVGISLILYADSNDDRLPVDDWAQAVAPWTNHYDGARCYSVPDKGRFSGYALNVEVLGKELKKLDPREVLLFETDAVGKGVIANLNARNVDRHKGGSFVFRADSEPDFIRKDRDVYPKRKP